MQAKPLKQIKHKPIAESAAGRAPVWAMPVVKTLLVLTDGALAAACFVTAFRVREDGAVFGVAGEWWSAEFAPYGALLAFVVAVRVLTYFYNDLYRLRGEFAYVDELARVFKATATGSLLIVAAAFLYRGGFEYRAFSYARAVFFLDFALALIAMISLRVAVRGAQTLVRWRGVNLIPTLVVGCNAEAGACIAEMTARPSLGYRVIGVVESRDEGKSVMAGRAREGFAGAPVVGALRDLADVIRRTGANEVIIADAEISRETLFETMIAVGRRRGVEFRLAPTLFNCLPRKTEIDQIGALPMIRLFREPLSRAARLTKRLADIAISGAALFVLAPVWIVIALLIKLDSKGAVFFRQERVGMDGRIFLCFKFRTMHTDADDRTHREFQQLYIAGRPETNFGDDTRPVYKMQGDPRVTRVGSVLRRLSLDELPQLFNVLAGTMSVVGPRPPIPYEVEFYQTAHRRRLDMKPGLTGLWQVSGRNRLSFDEMVRLDVFYIENWSLWLDVKIMLQTLPVMLRGDAY